MKLDIAVKNLGKIKDAQFKVRPITLLAGKNGTGKSFFTKTLYSILNVANKNLMHIELTKDFTRCYQYTDILVNEWKDQEGFDQVLLIKSSLEKLQDDFNQAKMLKLLDYLHYSATKKSEIEYIIDRVKKLSPPKILHSYANLLGKNINKIISKISNAQEAYNHLFHEILLEEITENLQTNDPLKLINFHEKFMSIESSIGAYIYFAQLDGSTTQASFRLSSKFIEEAFSLSRVIFFESPAYWKVRKALHLAQTSSVLDTLTGVPKYFYDLETLLQAQIKTDAKSEIKILAEQLEMHLGGEFNFQSSKIVFKDKNTQKDITLNLMSSGMTSLGLIHKLLKNNVINKGSFVFFDEPETNLHPDWQVLLIDILIQLAKQEVNIVIATHSVDIIKALEVGLKRYDKSEDNDFCAVHYLDTDGSLLEFDAKQPLQQLAEVRSELSATYEALYFEGQAL